MLQLFEGVLANAGVRLVEGEAGVAQQVSQVAFRHRGEALQQVLPDGFGDGGGLVGGKIVTQLLLDGFICGGHGGSAPPRFRARRYWRRTRGRPSHRRGPRSRANRYPTGPGRGGWRPGPGWPWGPA